MNRTAAASGISLPLALFNPGNFEPHIVRQFEDRSNVRVIALLFLRQVPAPLIVGGQALTALQSTLARECWPGATLPAPQPEAKSGVHTRLLRAADLEQELAACARWCRAHIERTADE